MSHDGVNVSEGLTTGQPETSRSITEAAYRLKIFVADQHYNLSPWLAIEK